MQPTPYIVFLGLVALNVCTFLIYGLDKYCARNGSWRIPEGTLLVLALAGGSPAAYLAQKIFRHKTHKQPFRIRFWLIVALQMLALIAFIIKATVYTV